MEVHYHRCCYSNYTRFLSREEKETHKSTSIKTIYEKSYGIFCKDVIETQIIQGKEIKYMKEQDNVDASKYRASKLKQRLRKDYPALVFLLPKKRNVSEIVYVENLDTSELVEEHMVHASDESEGEMDEEGYLTEEDVCDKESSTISYPEMNKLQILYNAALILKQKIEDIPRLELPWPPLASDLTMDNVKKFVPYELFNTLAWICGLSSEPVLNDYVNINGKESAKLMSITEDLVTLASKQRNPSPKSIALAMALRQLTGSASVISLVSGLGHCMSHSYVLAHETALAQLNISKDDIIPSGFDSTARTTLAWDNDDFSEETRSGKGTTHITGGMIIQRDTGLPSTSEKRESVPRKRSVAAPLQNIQPYFIGKRKTVVLEEAMHGMEIGESHHIEAQIEAKEKDLAFCLCRYLGKGEFLPNWTGYNTKLVSKQNIPVQSKIGYLPIIDASPTEFSTVNEILRRSEKISDKLNLRYICLVFDEAIYSKVQQIRWKEERYLNRFIVRLGDFHMAMAFCGAISKLFKDAGLKVLRFSKLIHDGFLEEKF